MKRLFVMDNEGDIDLNKEWLHMVPEFSVILHRVWKCEGDSDGRKKLMQHRIFSYIYLTLDFGSPLFTWDQEARHIEALKSQNLKEADVADDPKVQAAIRKYDEYMQESSPKLKALRGMHAALDKMNQHLQDIDLSEEDKQGKPKYTVATITRAMKEMNAAYDALEQMERRVLEELKKEGGNTIRGTATLGGKEGKRKTDWKEGEGPTKTEIQKSVDKAIEEDRVIAATDSSPDYRRMGTYLNNVLADRPDEYDSLGEEDE